MKYHEPLNQQILKHLSEGLTIKEIAGEMNLSKTAIEKRLLKMRKETETKSNAHLIIKCTFLRASET